MDDPADHPPVIDTRFAPHVRGKKWANPVPLLVAKPKKIASHHASPNHFADSESATDSDDNMFIGYGP